MSDLSISLCGLSLKNPLILASGIMGVSAAAMKSVELHGAGAVTSKSIGPVERLGHKNPTVYAWEHGLTNAVGLPNPGVEAAISMLKEARSVLSVPLIISMFADTADNFAHVAEKLLEVKPQALEINLSCPNTERDFGPMFALDPQSTGKVITAVKKISGKTPVFAKLTPDAANSVEIGKAAEAAGADALTAANTVSGLIIDIRAKQPILTNKFGGISGPAIKPIIVRMVYNLSKAVKIPIIGLGGVNTGEDAVEMIMAGATAVGIGSAVYYRGIEAFSFITDEMKAFMKKEGYKTVGEMKGIVHNKDGASL